VTLTQDRRTELLGGCPLFGGVIQDDLAGNRSSPVVRAAIGHALAFPTWRSLFREQGLSTEEAVELMCRLVEDAASPART